ncbi:energy-coupling factor transporter transmembrane component T family protein [Microlunatus sp. Y2014]|uniref:energy-coupling factor transporter transmembrane component T family protein n=1 Tax=Microlunatus sp. Y2014 TaxID=3418488 RepID=UPI003DA7579C
MSALLIRADPASPLARRNPTVKLALLFVVSVGLLFLADPVSTWTLYGLALLSAWAGTRIRPRTLLLAQLPFLAFGFGVFWINVLSRPGEVLWQYGLLRVTVEGLGVGAALAARALTIGVLSIALIHSTDAVRLMASLHQHARLPARVSYAVMSGYRLLELLGREWVTIRRAQDVRAPLDAKGRPRRGLRTFTSAGFTLLITALRRGERVAESLESRGLGLQPRTIWRPVPIGPGDVWLVVGVLAVMGAVIALAGWAGVLQGPGALF